MVTSTPAPPASSTTSPTTTSTRSGIVRSIVGTLAGASRLNHRGGRGAARGPRGALRRGAGGHPDAVRRARGDPSGRGRQPVPRVQAAVRRDAGLRVRADLGTPGRHRGQQRDPVQRVGAQGRALHRAVQPARHPAGVPAEHHRLHGRPGVREQGHRPRRRQAGHRGRLLGGAEVHRRDRRLVRRRQLRHVRSGLRPPVPVDVAERPHLGDGRRAGRVGAGRRARRQRRPGSSSRTTRSGSATSTPPRARPTTPPRDSWDDGVIDPVDTRRVLGMGLAAAAHAPIAEPSYGVFRM